MQNEPQYETIEFDGRQTRTQLTQKDIDKKALETEREKKKAQKENSRKEARRDLKRERDHVRLQRVEDVLREHPEGLSKRQLMIRTGYSPLTFDRILFCLETADRVRCARSPHSCNAIICRLKDNT